MAHTKGLSRARVENAKARIEAGVKMARELVAERALADALADILTTAQEHIAQYVAYSEAMREFGRGMSPDSAWTADNLTAQMAGILARHTAARKGGT